MGWKQYFKIGSAEFKKYYDENRSWGDLRPIRIVFPDREVYGAGELFVDSPYLFSPKISHPIGVKTRVTVRLYFVAKANAPVGSRSFIGVVFYKNGETAKSTTGYDFHGFSISVSRSPTTTAAEEHTLTVEQDNNRVVFKLAESSIEAQFTDPLQSFALAVKTDSNTGIVIHEVVAEYYDQLEDMFNMMFNVMMIGMFAMMAVVFVSTFMRAFRGREERA